VRHPGIEATLLDVRRSFLLGVTASVILIIGLLSPFAGCSSSNSASPDGGDDNVGPGDVNLEGPNFCDLDAFDKAGMNGGPCSPIDPDKPCFLLCETSMGGCSCVMGPKGTGIWQCTVDDSCMPKCAPMDPDCGLDGAMFVDTGPIPEASLPDGFGDEPSDGSGDVAHADATPDSTPDSMIDGGAKDSH
jgi:hypothetical protein